MSILIHNCTAVRMDEAGTVLPTPMWWWRGQKIRSVRHPAALGLL